MKSVFALPLLAALLVACAGAPEAPLRLEGTTWQLVRFQGGDGAVLAPDDRSKYSFTFAPQGRLSARLDCNRGAGGWKSAAPGQIELTQMAMTRAMCPQGSLDAQIAKRLGFVRSYVVRDGRLYLSLQADGGVLELEPAPRN